MDLKPGWQSTEWWTTLAHQIIVVLALVGVIGQADAAGLDGALAKAVAATFMLLSSGWVVVRYIEAHLKLKSQPAAILPPTWGGDPGTGSGSGTGAGLTVFVILLALASPAAAAPQDAVVRITSHGCSGTVIATEAGRTWVLSCGHAFEGADATKAIVLDVPAPAAEAAPRRTGSGPPRLMRVDYKFDASLIYVPTGPLPYCCPVAALGTRPGKCLSVGYDEMRDKVTCVWATPVAFDARVTWTAEKPWHGRSGGALIDHASGRLVGIVQGYIVGPGGRGMYTSHTGLYQFCFGNPPRTYETREPSCGH